MLTLMVGKKHGERIKLMLNWEQVRNTVRTWENRAILEGNIRAPQKTLTHNPEDSGKITWFKLYIVKSGHVNLTTNRI